jgi:hypothetical protein
MSCPIVGTEDAMVYGAVAHGTFAYKTLWSEFEQLAPHYTLGQTTTVDRRNRSTLSSMILYASGTEG